MRFAISVMSFLTFGLIYIGCNRHSIQKPIPRPEKMVSGWVDSGNADDKTQYIFDQANHVTKEESASEISSYEFLEDSVIIKEFSKDENRFVYEFRGRLDTNKRLVSGIANSSYITTAPDTVYQCFEYNKEGFLAREERISASSDSFSIEYEYKDNQLKKAFTYSNGELYNTKEFEYYQTDFTPGLPENFKFRGNINRLVGRSSGHLVKKIVSKGKNGKQKYTIRYEYQKDPDGYAYKVIGKKGKKTRTVVNYFYAPLSNSSTGLLAAVN